MFKQCRLGLCQNSGCPCVLSYKMTDIQYDLENLFDQALHQQQIVMFDIFQRNSDDIAFLAFSIRYGDFGYVIQTKQSLDYWPIPRDSSYKIIDDIVFWRGFELMQETLIEWEIHNLRFVNRQDLSKYQSIQVDEIHLTQVSIKDEAKNTIIDASHTSVRFPYHYSDGQHFIGRILPSSKGEVMQWFEISETDINKRKAISISGYDSYNWHLLFYGSHYRDWIPPNYTRILSPEELLEQLVNSLWWLENSMQLIPRFPKEHLLYYASQWSIRGDLVHFPLAWKQGPMCTSDVLDWFLEAQSPLLERLVTIP